MFLNWGEIIGDFYSNDSFLGGKVIPTLVFQEKRHLFAKIVENRRK
jgi:hypothetical protein